MKIILTEKWSFDQIAAYGPDITAAMRKLVDRFPTEFTVKSIFEDIRSGKAQLWLILDDDDRFLSFVLSEILINPVTGYKTVALTELGGEGGVDVVPLIGEIETWAREQGASELRPMGRMGWRKALASQGYKANIVIYRKMLTDE